jgi:hypothetical protein
MNIFLYIKDLLQTPECMPPKPFTSVISRISDIARALGGIVGPIG